MANYRINAPVQLDYARYMKMDYGDIIVERADQIPDAAKVVYFGETLVDLTNDTVIPEVVTRGYTFHGSDGNIYEGTMESQTQSGSLIFHSENIYSPEYSIKDIGLFSGLIGLSYINNKLLNFYDNSMPLFDMNPLELGIVHINSNNAYAALWGVNSIFNADISKNIFYSSFFEFDNDVKDISYALYRSVFNINSSQRYSDYNNLYNNYYYKDTNNEIGIITIPGTVERAKSAFESACLSAKKVIIENGANLKDISNMFSNASITFPISASQIPNYQRSIMDNLSWFNDFDKNNGKWDGLFDCYKFGNEWITSSYFIGDVNLDNVIVNHDGFDTRFAFGKLSFITDTISLTGNNGNAYSMFNNTCTTNCYALNNSVTYCNLKINNLKLFGDDCCYGRMIQGNFEHIRNIEIKGNNLDFDYGYILHHNESDWNIIDNNSNTAYRGFISLGGCRNGSYIDTLKFEGNNICFSHFFYNHNSKLYNGQSGNNFIDYYWDPIYYKFFVKNLVINCTNVVKGFNASDIYYNTTYRSYANAWSIVNLDLKIDGYALTNKDGEVARGSDFLYPLMLNFYSTQYSQYLGSCPDRSIKIDLKNWNAQHLPTMASINTNQTNIVELSVKVSDILDSRFNLPGQPGLFGFGSSSYANIVANNIDFYFKNIRLNINTYPSNLFINPSYWRYVNIGTPSKYINDINFYYDNVVYYESTTPYTPIGSFNFYTDYNLYYRNIRYNIRNIKHIKAGSSTLGVVYGKSTGGNHYVDLHFDGDQPLNSLTVYRMRDLRSNIFINLYTSRDDYNCQGLINLAMYGGSSNRCDVYVANNRQMNIYKILDNTYSNYRNVYIHGNFGNIMYKSLFRNSSDPSWTELPDGNGYYNSTYNIYIYNNYKPSI